MSTNKKATKLQLGRVLRSKAGNSRIELGQPKDKEGNVIGGVRLFPITLADGTILNEGDILSVRDPREEIDMLVNLGKLDADVAETRKAKIPEFVLKNVTFDVEYNRTIKRG